jgi:gliding motility-associated-like protein
MGPRNKQPVQFGLPTFIQSYFDTASGPYDFSRIGNCLDRTIGFKINRLSRIDSVKWDFGDGQHSQVLQPTHTYLAGGFYDVKLIVYKVDCSGLNDTINRRIWIADKADFLGPDTTSCTIISIDIGVTEVYGVNYLWNTGFTGSHITTSGFGWYWLEMEQNGCKVRDSIDLAPRPLPYVNLGTDTSICAYKPVVLYSGSTGADSYLWNTGETSSSITINKTGTYSVKVTKNSCVASDTVLVTAGDCGVFIPSAFTPNNDSRNEKFGVITDAAVKDFSMQVFNKWGQMVFSSSNISDKWDGTFKGKNAPTGGYVWFLFYVNKKGERKYEQGTVMLIR